MTKSSGLRGGLLLALLGAFVISRTITHDSTGRTLIDRLLGRQGGGDLPANATNAQLDTLGQGQDTVIAPNRLSGQMAVNNVRLRVQQAIRTGRTPASGDVTFLKANVPGFNLAKLTQTTRPQLTASTLHSVAGHQ